MLLDSDFGETAGYAGDKTRLYRPVPLERSGKLGVLWSVVFGRQGALNNYQEAIALDPESPAADARKMVMDILNFYNKDMFNQ